MLFVGSCDGKNNTAQQEVFRFQMLTRCRRRLSGSERGLSAPITIYRLHAQVLAESRLVLCQILASDRQAKIFDGISDGKKISRDSCARKCRQLICRMAKYAANKGIAGIAHRRV
jgi:hypothetical protein